MTNPYSNAFAASNASDYQDAIAAHMARAARLEGNRHDLPDNNMRGQRPSPTRDSILTYLKANGPTCGRVLATALGLTAYQVSAALDGLSKRGDIVKTGTRNRGFLVWEESK